MVGRYSFLYFIFPSLWDRILLDAPITLFLQKWNLDFQFYCPIFQHSHLLLEWFSPSQLILVNVKNFLKVEMFSLSFILINLNDLVQKRKPYMRPGVQIFMLCVNYLLRHCFFFLSLLVSQLMAWRLCSTFFEVLGSTRVNPPMVEYSSII